MVNLLSTAAGFLALSLSLAAAPILITGTGANAAGIQPSVDALRAIFTPNNANAPGPLPGGHREINWDGGGSTTASPAGTPFAGFQNTRGALFTTPGTGFLQTPVDAPEFTSINPTYATTFQPFSPLRIFTPIDSNITDVTFSIPGSPSTPATVDLFAAIFSDVDVFGSTTLEMFDENLNTLGTFQVPDLNEGLSLLGVAFNAGERIARVRITSGNSILGPNDSTSSDVVVMDDFFFGEPQAAQVVVPEPSSLLLFIAGVGLLGFLARSRARY